MDKQLFSVLLTVLMIMVGARAFAFDISVVNDDGVTIYYSWTHDKTELAVTYNGYSHTQYPDRYIGNVVIPETVDYDGTTYNVTSIMNNAFDGCSNLTSVTVCNHVTEIGNSTFYNCSNLTSVTLPGNITKIGNSAFRGCSKLASISIPDKVTTIDEWAFSGCSSLSTLN